MVVFPHAKINLGLQVVEKRHDGFHNIISCFYPINWCDILEVLPASSFSFKSTGLTIPGAITENLCVKAYQLLQADFSLPDVQIHLHKIIPIGAGLGGGSADATYTLCAVRDLFDIPITPEEMSAYASKLGSDCSFFLEEEPAVVTGVGDQVARWSVDLPAGFLVVIYPDIHVSTQEAYASLSPQPALYDLPNLVKEAQPSTWRHALHNDFEESVFEIFPEISELKELLYQRGAQYASMSGSGASVYGFFENSPELNDLPQHYRVWCQKI